MTKQGGGKTNSTQRCASLNTHWNKSKNPLFFKDLCLHDSYKMSHTTAVDDTEHFGGQISCESINNMSIHNDKCIYRHMYINTFSNFLVFSHVLRTTGLNNWVRIKLILRQQTDHQKLWIYTRNAIGSNILSPGGWQYLEGGGETMGRTLITQSRWFKKGWYLTDVRDANMTKDEKQASE